MSEGQLKNNWTVVSNCLQNDEMSLLRLRVHVRVFHSARSWRGRLRRISSEWERTLFSLIAFLHRSGCVELESCRSFFSENAEQGERRRQRVCLYRPTSEKGILPHWQPADWDPQRTESCLIVRCLEVWHNLNFGLNISEARRVLSPSWSLPLSYRGFRTTDFIIFRLQTCGQAPLWGKRIVLV